MIHRADGGIEAVADDDAADAADAEQDCAEQPVLGSAEADHVDRDEPL